MRLSSGRTRRLGRPSRDSWARTAARLAGPLYAAVDAGPAYEGGYGHSGSGRDQTVSVAVRHVRPGGELEVDSSDAPSWEGEHVAWRLAAEWVHQALRPGPLTFPLVLRADRWERDVAVDGVAVPFVFVGSDDAWCALGSPGGRDVSVSGTGWPRDDLALHTVHPRDVFGHPPHLP